MALWVDKYRPADFTELSYNEEQSDMVRRLVSNDDFPHLLFHGPDGVGKMTRVRCALKQIYGDGALQLKTSEISYLAAGNKPMKINVVDSKFHIEIRPSDAGLYDRIVVQTVIKQVASQFLSGLGKSFKVAVIHEADRLSFDAQQALRRTMEKHSGACKLFLCVTQIHKIIEPLVSRCVPIRLGAPSDENLIRIIKNVADKEKVKVMDPFARTLVDRSDSNVRRAILMFEATVVKFGKNKLHDSERVVTPDWMESVSQIASQIVNKKGVDTAHAVRPKFYDLINALIPLDVIFERLCIEIDNRLSTASDKLHLWDTAAKYQHRSLSGDKPVLYLEAFVLEYMTKHGTQAVV